MGNVCARRRDVTLSESSHEFEKLVRGEALAPKVTVQTPDKAVKMDLRSTWLNCCIARQDDAEEFDGVTASSSKSTPTCLPYHEQSDLRSAAGYIGNLTEEESQQLRRIKREAQRLVGSIAPWLLQSGETEDQFLLRFLRAREFKIDKALTMLQADIEWRCSTKIREFSRKSEQEVLGFSPDVIHRYIPWRHLGFDKQGRPVIAKHMGCKTVLKEAFDDYDWEKFVQYHIWQHEQYGLLLSSQSKRLGRSVEQIVFIVDSKGWHVGLASRQAFKFLRAIASVDSDHYPERLGLVVIINAPSTMAFAWRVIRSWLTERQQRKVFFCKDEAEAYAALSPHMAHDVISKDCGGSGPHLGFT